MNSYRSIRGNQKGQVLPLAAIALLAMACMAFISLNVSWTVHNRIRLQNYSDAKAYSTAVAVARTYNWFAYSNRATANAYVSMATLHAYMSMAAAMASVDWGMFEGFGEVAAEEEALSDACFAAWDIEGGVEHLIHSIEAGINAIGYMIAWIDGTEGNRIQKLDSPYGKAFDALSKQVDVIWDSQKAVKDIAEFTYLPKNQGPGGGLLGGGDKLQENNMKAPGASSGVDVTDTFPALGVMNAAAFSDTINSKGDDDDKKKEMSDVVNATRTPFAWDRNGFSSTLTPGTYPGNPLAVLYPMIKPIEDDAWIDSDSFHFFAIEEMINALYFTGGRTYAGTKKVSTNFFGGFNKDADPNSADKLISSGDWLNVNFSWKDGVAEFATPAFIPTAPAFIGQLTTGESDSDHTGCAIYSFDLDLFNNPHDSVDHSKALHFDHFMDYKIKTSAPFNQPAMYASAGADLKMGDANQKRPWEVNGNPLKLGVGTGSDTVGRNGVENATGVGNITLSDNGGSNRGDGKGQALSKAQVYYHRFGDWREAPNFFNPYWRAKMEAWNSIGEMDKALAASAISGAGGSVGADAILNEVDALGSGALNIK